ncbi:MAG: phosphatase PAP2 family protein [Clostridiales bacterium]|nr:phosphatase PAP2 family protein [Clostridiales bacterium]
MVFMTKLGDGGAVWIALGLTLFAFPKTRRRGAYVLVCLLAVFLVNNCLLKPIVARPRPYVTIEGLSILVNPLQSYSFPSGHAASSFAAALAMVLFFGRKGGYAYIPAVLIAFSRCYVGVHYPSDVIGGAIVGTLSSFGLYVLIKKYSSLGFDPKRRM